MLSVAEKLTFAEGYIDFLGRKNLWIKNNYDEEQVNKLLRYIILESLLKTSPNQIEIICFDDGLSGAFAPFSDFTSGEQRLMRVINRVQELEKYLEVLKDHIQMVQNILKGIDSSLIDYRSRHQFPVESYKLVILYLDVSSLDSKLQQLLSIILKKSAAAGVSVVVVSYFDDGDYSFSPKNFSNMELIELYEESVYYPKNSQIWKYSAYKEEDIVRICKQILSNNQKTAFPTIHFFDINHSSQSKYWSRNSTTGITFTIGKTGMNDTEVTIGDEINQRHNILVTGAVGQGKSNLLSTIIHSICYNYSPEEVRLFLLDYKEGVTLKPYSNIGKEDYLPHADVLGLESDVDFGKAVLEHLFLEYQKRLKQFKKYNVQNIQQYRQKTGKLLARIVLIIDEFQLMFGEDSSVANDIAELLEKSVRLFRAAGIHIILSSQSLGGSPALLGKSDNIFSQIPIRLVHKNSLQESYQSLSINNDAAVYLRPREAIINLDYGEASQNRKSVIAYADETVLEPLRKSWWQQRQKLNSPPVTFDSEQRFFPTEKNIFSVESTEVPLAYLGRAISVSGEVVAVPLSNDSGQNIALFGLPDKENNTILGVFYGIITSLYNQCPNARYIVCDFTGSTSFNQALTSEFSDIDIVLPVDFSTKVEELTEYVRANQFDGKTFVFAIGLDYWKVDINLDPPLRELLVKGPGNNTHFIGWWTKDSIMKEQALGYNSNDIFNTKLFFRTDERVVQNQASVFTKWKYKPNRALVYNEVEFGGAQMIIPFSYEEENNE